MHILPRIECILIIVSRFEDEESGLTSAERGGTVVYPRDKERAKVSVGSEGASSKYFEKE